MKDCNKVYSKIYFSKQHYYSRGQHGCTSASGDILDEAFDAIAPTLFSTLTFAETMIINEIFAIEATHRARSIFLDEQRNLRNIENLRERTLSIFKEAESEFVPPQGEIVNLSEFLQQTDGFTLMVANEIIVPINVETLSAQRDELKAELDASIEDQIHYTIRYVNENIQDKKFHRWWLDEYCRLDKINNPEKYEGDDEDDEIDYAGE